MRHKYATPAFVLAKYPRQETEATVMLLTAEFGIIPARAQGLRKTGSKMAMALQTFSESEVMLVRGKEGWRLTGALLVKNWASELAFADRKRAGRVIELMQRLVHGELSSPRLYDLALSFTGSLSALEDEASDAAEVLAALRILQALGHDAGTIPGEWNDYDETILAEVIEKRKEYIARVNNGIAASGL